MTNHFPTMWTTRRNQAGRRGISCYLKVLFCLRRLDADPSLDDINDSSKLTPETLRQYFLSFFEHILELYGSKFLDRRPSKLTLMEKNIRRMALPDVLMVSTAAKRGAGKDPGSSWGCERGLFI